MFVLNGVFRNEAQEAFFTEVERQTAVEIAQEWFRKGWQPRLKEYNRQGAMVVNFHPVRKMAA
jgi:hypothetical protein